MDYQWITNPRAAVVIAYLLYYNDSSIQSSYLPVINPKLAIIHDFRQEIPIVFRHVDDFSRLVSHILAEREKSRDLTKVVGGAPSPARRAYGELPIL